MLLVEIFFSSFQAKKNCKTKENISFQAKKFGLIYLLFLIKIKLDKGKIVSEKKKKILEIFFSW